MSETTGLADTQCYYCGLYHDDVCGRVESIEYHPNGTVRKITFHADAPVVSLYGLNVVDIEAGAERIRNGEGLPLAAAAAQITRPTPTKEAGER